MGWQGLTLPARFFVLQLRSKLRFAAKGLGVTIMNERHILFAFLATLLAIVVLVITGAIMAANGKPTEALGIGGAVTGLIGVIGTMKPRNVLSDAGQGQAG
jgi:hypothetical protein